MYQQLPYLVISLVSSTPHPHMPRGPPTLLSSKSIKKFSTLDQHHPRLWRHYAAQRVIDLFLLIFHPRPEHHLSPHRVPTEMSELCLHYNTYYLHLVTDLQLFDRYLWRIIHRSYFKDWQPCPAAAIHSAYYFQMRKTTLDEQMLSSQKREQPLCHNIIGKDILTLTAKNTILQTDGVAMMYLFINTHCSTHGYLDKNLVPQANYLFNRVGVNHPTILPANVGPSAEISMNNISVAYSGSVSLFTLKKSLAAGSVTLQQNLAAHMLHVGGSMDVNRTAGKIIPNENCTTIHLQCGYGQIQSVTNPSTWFFNGGKMPTGNT